MSSISRFFNSQGSENKSLSDVFDFDNFADHVKLTTHISGSQGVDYNKVDGFIYPLLNAYNYQPDLNRYVTYDFIITLLDEAIKSEVSDAITSHNQSFSYQNASHAKNLRDLVYSIFNITKNGSNVLDTANVFRSKVLSFANMDTIKVQLEQMSSASINSFYSNFKNYGETEDDFKKNIATILMDKLYVVFYFAHIHDRIMFCKNFKCKRSFILAKYVFVYHVLMSVFLIIFSSGDSVQSYKTVTQKDNASLQQLKYRLVAAMDSILSLIQEENILDSPGMDNTSTISKYYDRIKDLSDRNVLKSNHLNERKRTALVMQNNLANYTNYEALAYRELYSARMKFVTIVVSMIIVVLFLLGLAMGQQFLLLYITGGIVMLVLAINGLLSAMRQ